MSSADGAGQSVDRLGEEFFELFETLIALIRSVGIRQQEADEQRSPGDFRCLLRTKATMAAAIPLSDGESQEISRAQVHACLEQHFLDGGDAAERRSRLSSAGIRLSCSSRSSASSSSARAPELLRSLARRSLIRRACALR